MGICRKIHAFYGENSSKNSRKIKFFVHKIELLHLFSAPDTLRTGALSKLISARLESNLYQKALGRAYTAQNNHDTRLFPTLDLGLGVGSYAGNFAFYGLLGVGYRYELLHNPYASLKSGVAASFSRVKVLAQYELFYDFNDDNRGYDSRLALFAGLNAFKQVDIFAEFNAYHRLFGTRLGRFRFRNSAPKIHYLQNQSVNFKVGVSVNF